VEEELYEIDGEDVTESEPNAAVGLFDIDSETLLLVVDVGMKDVVAIPLVDTENVEVTQDDGEVVLPMLAVNAALADESAIVDEGESDSVRDESIEALGRGELLEVLLDDVDKVPETDGERLSSVETEEEALIDGLSDDDSEFEELCVWLELLDEDSVASTELDGDCALETDRFEEAESDGVDVCVFDVEDDAVIVLDVIVVLVVVLDAVIVEEAPSDTVILAGVAEVHSENKVVVEMDAEVECDSDGDAEEDADIETVPDSVESRLA
jgi:hypothetical protein